MIDPNKPLWDEGGREWVALRRPHGSAYVTATGNFLACLASGDEVPPRYFRVDTGQGVLCNTKLCNTKPELPQTRQRPLTEPLA
jgi:hypothetical protein